MFIVHNFCVLTAAALHVRAALDCNRFSISSTIMAGQNFLLKCIKPVESNYTEALWLDLQLACFGHHVCLLGAGCKCVAFSGLAVRVAGVLEKLNLRVL